MRIVAKIDVHHAEKALSGCACRSEQKYGERDLCGDHCVMRAAAAHIA